MCLIDGTKIRMNLGTNGMNMVSEVDQSNLEIHSMRVVMANQSTQGEGQSYFPWNTANQNARIHDRDNLKYCL